MPRSKLVRKPAASLDAARRLNDLVKAANAIRDQCNAVRADWLTENGICEYCGGKGTDRYRPTIDYQDQYETVACTGCDGRDRLAEIPVFESAELTAANAEADDARLLLAEIVHAEAHPIGLTVEVECGRLAPAGTVGVVGAVIPGPWSTALIIRPEGQPSTRTNLKNVHVLDAEGAARRKLHGREVENARRIAAYDRENWVLRITDDLWEDDTESGVLKPRIMAIINMELSARLAVAGRWLKGVI